MNEPLLFKNYPDSNHTLKNQAGVEINRSNKQKTIWFFSILGSLVVLLLLVGVVVSIKLIQSNQEIRQQASSSVGTATVSISPSTAQINVGSSQVFTVSFNPQNNVISGISIRLQFPISNNLSLITPDNPATVITQSDQNWSCPVANTEVGSSFGFIDVGCLYLATSGFTAQSNINLFTVKINAGNTPTTSPITLSFDPTQTIITRKSDNKDVAAVPQSSANISIIGNPTPTPTLTPTPSPSPANQVNTANLTPSPTLSYTKLACTQTCLANRDCGSNLSCIDGQCLDERCPNDLTCQCNDYNPTLQTGNAELPDSGSITLTFLSFISGLFLILGSGGVILAQLGKKE